MKREIISEALGNISEKHLNEAIEYKKKNNLWKIAAASAAVLVLIIGIVMFAGGGNELTKNNSNIYINDDDLSIAMGDMDIQIEQYDVNNVSESIRESFADRVGISFTEFTARIPEGFEVNSMWADLSRYDEKGIRHEEYRAYDYRFQISTPEGGLIRIAVCGVGEPLRDCVVVCENEKPSIINGVEMFIYRVGDTYYAFFESKDILFDVEAENTSVEELEELIMRIM